MKTLIDLDAVRQVINNNEVLMHLSWEDIGKIIGEIEKIEPEELIKCKDCRYGVPIKDGKIRCEGLLSGEAAMYPNEYCSFAERREDATHNKSCV